MLDEICQMIYFIAIAHRLDKYYFVLYNMKRLCLSLKGYCILMITKKKKKKKKKSPIQKFSMKISVQ